MDDLTRVTGPSSPLEGRSAKVIAVVVIAILIAMIKPWNDSSTPAVARATPGVPTPMQTLASPTPFDPLANYDHELFGIYEPAARWELWPAGYLVSFGFAMRIDSGDVGDPGGSPVPGVSSPPPGSEGPGTGQPIWPATIHLIAGGLQLVGINTPPGFTVARVAVTRLDQGGAQISLPVVNAPSRWPDHFTVIGIDDGTQQPLESWPRGRYRLDLQFEPGTIVRSIELDVGEVVAGPAGSSDPAESSTAPSPRSP